MAKADPHDVRPVATYRPRAYLFRREIDVMNSGIHDSTLILFQRKLRRLLPPGNPSDEFQHLYRASLTVTRVAGSDPMIDPLPYPVATLVSFQQLRVLTCRVIMKALSKDKFRLVVEGERDPQFDSVIFGDNASISVSIWLPDNFEWDKTDVKSDVDAKSNEAFWRYEPAPKNHENRLAELRKQLEPERATVQEYREIGNNSFCEYQDLP